MANNTTKVQLYVFLLIIGGLTLVTALMTTNDWLRVTTVVLPFAAAYGLSLATNRHALAQLGIFGLFSIVLGVFAGLAASSFAMAIQIAVLTLVGSVAELLTETVLNHAESVTFKKGHAAGEQKAKDEAAANTGKPTMLVEEHEAALAEIAEQVKTMMPIQRYQEDMSTTVLFILHILAGLPLPKGWNVPAFQKWMQEQFPDIAQLVNQSQKLIAQQTAQASEPQGLDPALVLYYLGKYNPELQKNFEGFLKKQPKEIEKWQPPQDIKKALELGYVARNNQSLKQVLETLHTSHATTGNKETTTELVAVGAQPAATNPNSNGNPNGHRRRNGNSNRQG